MKKKAMWLIAAAVFAADRVTKILAAGIPAEGIPLIPGVVRLRYAENTGAAFSMLSGHPWLLGILSLIIIAGAFLFLHKNRPNAQDCAAAAAFAKKQIGLIGVT